MTPVASASLVFKGTSVWVYGAKRNISGKYEIGLDGQYVTLDGFSDVGLFQQVLFSAVDLNGSEWHSLSIVDRDTGTAGLYLDVDSVSILIM